MQCERGDGVRLEGDVLDREESGAGLWLRAWRCLNGGPVVDAVIAANRQRQPRAALAPSGPAAGRPDAAQADHPLTLVPHESIGALARASGVSARSGRRALRARRAPLGAQASLGARPFQREGLNTPLGELGKQSIIGDK